MLTATADHLRIFLHVLAATVWVGGQLTLAGLLPALRQAGDDVPAAVARQFNRLAWPAFAVLVATGIWNLIEVDVADTTTEYQVTLGIKLAVVTLSGISAGAHAGATSRTALAVWGAVSFVTALAAVFLGVQLRG